MENLFREDLCKHAPPESVPFVLQFLQENNALLIVKRPRKRCYGNFRASVPGKGQPFHRITVNSGLHPAHFLLVFLHEAAHLLVYTQKKNLRSPHGSFWQKEFRKLIQVCQISGFFPEQIISDIQYFIDEKCTYNHFSKRMIEVLEPDTAKNSVMISTLPEGTQFLFQGKTYRLGKKRRINYFATELKTKRLFLFKPIARVELFMAD
ncbi:MAG: SprT-like domain-containing protein [Bacteroidetes bacterium]|nr:SprT-like domain-containing protein [Bacteroidota bacterium]MBU1720421.1 SprT-like domain-containing protein [Bacteroidota bacterium]